MAENTPLNILVIDGQGGKIGKQLVSAVRQYLPRAVVTAVGTNGMATAAMIKAGAQHSATGENAVVVCCRTADVIIGPLGILVADSLLGEITPKMAVAVGQSSAQKLLLPLNRCHNAIVGLPELSVGQLVDAAVAAIRQLEAGGPACPAVQE